MGFDVLHQEFDGQHRDDEGDDHPDSEDRALVAGEMVEVAQLQQRAAEHRRDRQEERKFCGRGAGDPDHQRPDDRRAGAGRAGEEGRDQLEDPDDDRVLVGEIVDAVNPGLFGRVVVFDDDEQNPE